MTNFDKLDYATLRERDFKLNLTDYETRTLLNEATKRDITIEELLEDFIANFTSSTRSRGSDEVNLANEYVDRCLYYFRSTDGFAQWLTIEGNILQAICDIQEIEQTKTFLDLNKDELNEDDIKDREDDIDAAQMELDGFYKEYTEVGGKEDKEEAFKRLQAYRKRKGELLL